MMKQANQRGFSLLELTIGAMLTVGLMGTIFALVNRHQQVFLSETGTTDMNENIRTAVDLITRDVQSAGMGLPRINGSFASIYYINGNSNTPDSILMINGDPFAPDADVNSYDSATGKLYCTQPSEVKLNSSTFSYVGQNGAVTNIYQSNANQARQYIVYDDSQARLFTLSANATLDGTGQVVLTQTAGSVTTPASTFGSPVDTATPIYTTAKVAVLGSLIAYRLNTTTHELERTQDLQNWYAVARGILDLQIQYLTISTPNLSPPDPGTWTDTPTTRRNIRTVQIKIVAETPDLLSSSKNYRKAVQQFQVSPRNFNLLNNTNLSNNTKATWDF
ncbi:MAG: PilW family protein [Blastocatellia bacterium]